MQARWAKIAFVVCVLVFAPAAMGLLGGFTSKSINANDEHLNKAVEVASAEIKKKHKQPVEVELLSAETQVVAGTNYRLTLRAGDSSMDSKFYKATVWEKLPHEGGALDLTNLEEVDANSVKRDCPGDEAVDEAAAYAVEQLSSQSNSLLPFTLKEIVSSSHTNDPVPTYDLTLKLSHGTMPDQTFEVQVEGAPRGFTLKSTKQTT